MSEKDGDGVSSITDEVKTFNNRFSLSKMDYDLYHDEKNQVERLIRVKRFTNPNERWKIFDDQKLLFVVDGSKVNKKERAFLQGLDGVNFMIGIAKSGISTFTAFKTELKKRMAEVVVALTEKKR